MTRDADRLAMLETEVRQLREQLTSAQVPPRGRPPSRTKRTLLVVGLALALLITPAIALAAHQFGDVPNSNPFHADIAALVNSGVTAGCGGGNYCPKSDVTREQMAAFLNRLGALAPDKTPVVNADRVDGYHANQLVRVARGSISTSPNLSSTTPVTYGSVTITAPAAGFVLVTATPSVFGEDCTGGCNFTHQVRHVLTNAHSQASHDSAGVEPANLGSAPVTWVFPVSAGSHTFESRLHRGGGDGTLVGLRNALTALYTPFGNTGGSTLAFDEAPLGEPMPIPTE